MLALTAALVAPYFIDWSSYRSAFEREAGHILGREVQVEGTARARLLPFPSVTFTDVVVVDPETGEPAMTVDEFSMDAELAPFLRGEVFIFDMRLVRPNMRVEIAPDGTVDWAVRPSSRFNPRQVTLENVTVSDGTIAVHQQASGRTVRLSDIESELSARNLSGPWRVNGSLEIDGMPASLSAATGSVGEDGRMRVRISLEPRDFPIALTTDGHASFVEKEGLYAGTFQVRTVDQDGEERQNDQTESLGNRVSGRFSLNHQHLAVDEFLFETGPEDDPYTAEGRAMVMLGAEPSFSITADGAQIRIDPSDTSGDGVAGVSAQERLAALTEFMANLPKPTIPGTVAVNLPAIVAGDTTIRNIRIEAEPVDSGWSIHSAAATLPGRTRFEGEGLLETGESLSFDGHMLLAIGQPSGFASWLARDVDDVIRRLPSAGFAADVVLAPERQTFDNLELILGDARFGGAIDRRNPQDARPSLVLNLDGDRLDVEGMQAFASLFLDDTGRNRLASHDVDLEISAGPVTARGVTAERLETALRLREGAVEIDQLTITGLAGARISATGQVRDLGSTPTGRVDATIISVDLAPLTELLARRFPEAGPLSALARNAENFPGLLSDGEVNIVASAADNGDSSSSLAVSADGRAGGTEFSASISGQGTPADLASSRTTVNFTARNGAAVLYALFGLPALPLDLAGEAEVDLTATGVPADGMETTIKFAGDDLSADFEGEVAFTNEGFGVHGAASLESADLEPWLAVTGVSFPGFGFGLPVNLTAALEYSNELAVLSDISGHVAESAVSGDLNGELREGIPHLTGELTLSLLDLGIGAEMIAGSNAFQPDEGAWPQTPFRQNTSVPFSADVALFADSLWFGNTIGAENAQMHLVLEPGEFSVSELTATMFDGSVEGLAEFRNNEGTGLLSAQLSLDDIVLEDLLPDASLSGRGDLSASLTSSGRSVNAMAASLSGSGSVSLSDLRIMGIEDEALPAILDRADPLGIDIDAEDVAAFAPPLVQGGDFRANDVEFAFSAANGVVRTPPVQLESEHASVSVEAVADVGERTVSATGTIAYDPEEEGMAGSEPSVFFTASGPMGGARFDIDTEPLAQFLTQRALEREQRRVEHMQAVLLETQRLRREERYFEARANERRAVQAERIRLERQAEMQRSQRAERERQRAEQAAAESEDDSTQEMQGGDIPDAQVDEPQSSQSPIERGPLPPAQGNANSSNNQSQTGQTGIDIQSLTVDKLLELLDNKP